MKRWEYKTLTQKSRLNLPQLNECGADGWELVNTISVPNTGSYTLVFKRELEELDCDGWNYCSEVKPSGYDDALPKYFQVAVKFLAMIYLLARHNVTQPLHFVITLSDT